MAYTTLIDAGALAALVGNPSVAIVDCRFDLANTSAGEEAYARGHIPGAAYAHLDRDLSGPKTGANGRHPLPSPDVLVATIRRLGISNDTQVVAYDQDSGMYASRLWWLLRWLGHEAVAVLDGGVARWSAEGRPVTSAAPNRPAGSFHAALRPRMVVSADEVKGMLHEAGVRLIDARAPERYRGDVEPLDPVAGHIPGAVNHFFQRNLQDGCFRTPDALRAGFEETLGSTTKAQLVCYCGSGVTACHNLLALEQAGLTGARLYGGSWSEWVADSTRPVERG